MVDSNLEWPSSNWTARKFLVRRYHIARSLRGRAHTAKVLLIALTGYGQPEDVERALAAGFDYHFIKPVQPSVLHSLLLDEVLPSQDEAR